MNVINQSSWLTWVMQAVPTESAVVVVFFFFYLYLRWVELVVRAPSSWQGGYGQEEEEEKKEMKKNRNEKREGERDQVDEEVGGVDCTRSGWPRSATAAAGFCLFQGSLLPSLSYILFFFFFFFILLRGSRPCDHQPSGFVQDCSAGTHTHTGEESKRRRRTGG